MKSICLLFRLCIAHNGFTSLRIGELRSPALVLHLVNRPAAIRALFALGLLWISGLTWHGKVLSRRGYRHRRHPLLMCDDTTAYGAASQEMLVQDAQEGASFVGR